MCPSQYVEDVVSDLRIIILNQLYYTPTLPVNKEMITLPIGA